MSHARIALGFGVALFVAGPRIARAQPQVVHIRIDAPSGAIVSIDGQPLPDKAPLNDPPPAPVVVVPLPARAEAEWWGRSVPMQAGPSSEKVTTMLTLGVGVVAGLALGISWHVAAGVQASSIVKLQNGENPGGPAQIASAENQEATDENIRTGALIGAGVCAAAAAVVWLVWPDPKGVQSSRHVLPLVAPGMAGIGFVTAL
jgi:hypothetical protein